MNKRGDRLARSRSITLAAKAARADPLASPTQGVIDIIIVIIIPNGHLNGVERCTGTKPWCLLYSPFWRDQKNRQFLRRTKNADS